MVRCEGRDVMPGVCGTLSGVREQRSGGRRWDGTREGWAVGWLVNQAWMLAGRMRGQCGVSVYD